MNRGQEEEKEVVGERLALARLSKFEPHNMPAVNTVSRRGVIASRVVTALLLALATTFILLSLLLPTHRHGVSAMTIEPIGHQYIPSSPRAGEASTTIDSLPTGVWESIEENQGSRRKKRAPMERANAVVQPEEVGSVTWFGIEGPSVWVGPMQICSRSDWHAETVCTSASRPAYHVRVLPLSLGDSLLALPDRPVSPILLLVTLTATVLAALVYALPYCAAWAKSACAGPRLAPHPTFLALIVIGFALSIAAAVIERHSISLAIKAWDETVAEHVGLRIRLGALAHLMPLIPILLAAAALAGYTPAILHFYADLASPPPAAPGAEISTRAGISELFAETVQDSGKRLSNGSIVFSEVSPQTPGLPYTGSLERMPSIHVAGEVPVNRWSGGRIDYGQPSPPLGDEDKEKEGVFGIAV